MTIEYIMTLLKNQYNKYYIIYKMYLSMWLYILYDRSYVVIHLYKTFYIACFVMMH